MGVFGGNGLVSLVFQMYVVEVVHKHRVGLVGNYKGSTISIILVCTSKWLLVIAHWRGLLPRGLIKSLWLLPSLILPTLKPIFIIVSIPFNNIRTKLETRGVRIHSS
ncbi:hypothetical protein AHAS_Ahas15G0229200 [Arachis hypogaea]